MHYNYSHYQATLDKATNHAIGIFILHITANFDNPGL